VDVKYNVIYADPPWDFKSWSKKGQGRSAQAHYDCMSLNDIGDIPVADMASDNSVLLMWITDPFLDRGFDIIRKWGFTYKTVGFYWVKLNRKSPGLFTGMGRWTRANPEQCLLATKGSPKRKSGGVRKTILEPRREHSRKPDRIYSDIEKLVDGPYLEMFSRSSREGWDTWGNQAGLFDNGAVETRRFSSNSKEIE